MYNQLALYSISARASSGEPTPAWPEDLEAGYAPEHPATARHGPSSRVPLRQLAGPAQPALRHAGRPGIAERLRRGKSAAVRRLGFDDMLNVWLDDLARWRMRRATFMLSW